MYIVYTLSKQFMQIDNHGLEYPSVFDTGTKSKNKKKRNTGPIAVHGVFSSRVNPVYYNR